MFKTVVTCVYARVKWFTLLCGDVVNQVLDVVQSNLAEYEKLTGRQSEDQARSTASPTGFSGYTMALLEAVAKMSVYVKEVVC